MSPIVKAAADRAAQLRRELAQLDGVATLAAQAEEVLNSSRVLQINNTTIAMGDGANFDTHITDPELVTRVRQIIADDREAKAAALIGSPASESPQRTAELQPAPAPESPAASSAAAVDSTPAAPAVPPPAVTRPAGPARSAGPARVAPPPAAKPAPKPPTETGDVW